MRHFYTPKLCGVRIMGFSRTVGYRPSAELNEHWSVQFFHIITKYVPPESNRRVLYRWCPKFTLQRAGIKNT